MVTKNQVSIPSPRWEASLNVFHRDAVNHVLPYCTLFDKISRWVHVCGLHGIQV